MSTLSNLERVQQIDRQIAESFNELRAAAADLDFPFEHQFILRDPIEKEILNSLQFPGVYLIEIKNDKRFNRFSDWIEHFRNIWQDEELRGHFVPGLKKKRIAMHAELNEWIPLYIGKSRNISARFSEHLYFAKERNTFALKLYIREALLPMTFRLRAVRIPLLHYDQIMPVIESVFRERHQPIIGKQ